MNSKNPINIFIVEDNKVFALALKADIEKSFDYHNIIINLFETGEACKKRFMEVRPHVVLLDYHLNSKYPEAADGIEILDWIKKEKHNTKVIILTSDDKIDIAIKSFKHGASDYVVKTETQFMKINYSLSNLFKMIKGMGDAKKYKFTINLLLGFIALLVAAVIAVLLFVPSHL